MTVAELIAELQNYPMETEVFGYHVKTVWCYGPDDHDGIGGSYEENIVTEEKIEKVEKYNDGDKLAVIIS